MRTSETAAGEAPIGPIVRSKRSPSGVVRARQLRKALSMREFYADNVRRLLRVCSRLEDLVVDAKVTHQGLGYPRVDGEKPRRLLPFRRGRS